MTTTSNSNQTAAAAPPQPKSRDSPVDPPQRHGTSAYIDRSEYDTYQQTAAAAAKQEAANRGAYANYAAASNTDNNKARLAYKQDALDNTYPNNQQDYYTGSQASLVQPRVISAKQRNMPTTSAAYQVRRERARCIFTC